MIRIVSSTVIFVDTEDQALLLHKSDILNVTLLSLLFALQLHSNRDLEQELSEVDDSMVK